MDWTNQNWKQYIKRGERVVSHETIHPNICKINAWIMGVFFSLVFSWLVFVFVTLVYNEIIGSDVVFNPIYSILCGVLLGGLCGRIIYLSYRSVHFVLTTRGIYKISGLISDHVKYVSYQRVTDATISRGIFDKIFNTGSVGVGTASGGNVDQNGFQKNELDITGVENYKKINEYILSKIK